MYVFTRIIARRRMNNGRFTSCGELSCHIKLRQEPRICVSLATIQETSSRVLGNTSRSSYSRDHRFHYYRPPAVVPAVTRGEARSIIVFLSGTTYWRWNEANVSHTTMLPD